ncbi:ABC transporter ATP-binding protein [Desulfopila sp. IMCC35008]|uniref:ABC transporter ATP-binding protein n=1 Tax=Desulfopila sp. IMCC35008 TaxID=2653858 RepID=UPI0013D62378|nr:ABC transporter ATP-binding protein [Desulfopila sp. IMCC35008]
MLSAKNISKKYVTDGKSVSVLKEVSLDLQEGEFASIIGRSGSGKTTLLNVLSTLVRPDEGVLRYQGQDLAGVEENRLNTLRMADFAVIFQFHHLLPYLTVLENTLLPFMNSVKPVDASIKERARACLDRVGLADKAHRLPGNLSGGEQQRVAIARALVKSARILFADEPTGSLDRATGEQIMTLLSDLHRDGLSIVMVTHEPDYAGLAQRTIELEDGIIVH